MITKEKIEEIKDEIFQFAKENKVGKDFQVFCNGNRYGYGLSRSKNGGYYYRKEIKKNVNPHDYCEYYPNKFIIGLSYDGEFYEMMNGYIGYGIYDKFEELFKKHDMYIEHADMCHASIVYEGDYKDVEYTEFTKEEPTYIYQNTQAPDTKIEYAMLKWKDMSTRYGDQGACVIGAFLEFRYNGILYRMSPQSPYQGSMSWESGVDKIKEILSNFGATDIHFNYGILD